MGMVVNGYQGYVKLPRKAPINTVMANVSEVHSYRSVCPIEPRHIGSTTVSVCFGLIYLVVIGSYLRVYRMALCRGGLARHIPAPHPPHMRCWLRHWILGVITQVWRVSLRNQTHVTLLPFGKLEPRRTGGGEARKPNRPI
ncbi:hypothetical protein BABINDRAFT_154057 [Babjeviella inositovora NRRL Y-12698]|uniref:Uncharacterized protein n=1 Tax=Babjeviella inositovora NRRL Y-12698 TaxID=984486 RepID=A0A1E3QME0_9ASCO|nr:uncharacterized protein BABINDRAFT_154057 [Babjeviella inositovora NRRL Y-12698]ODQ78853.1 hypothetical protein BABINDRAFT_154057 [Babjeviella inositovora NRRL Y-12698]